MNKQMVKKEANQILADIVHHKKKLKNNARGFTGSISLETLQKKIKLLECENGLHIKACMVISSMKMF